MAFSTSQSNKSVFIKTNFYLFFSEQFLFEQVFDIIGNFISLQPESKTCLMHKHEAAWCSVCLCCVRSCLLFFHLRQCLYAPTPVCTLFSVCSVATGQMRKLFHELNCHGSITPMKMSAISNYTHNLQFSWISIRRKIFIINFLFKILTRVKWNYLCSHLQIRLGEANRIVTLFFYFSHICVSGSSALLVTLPTLPLDLIRCLTF